jgi:hypothetical protein
VDLHELIYLLGIGEPIVEPEVDLSNFLERQRLADDTDLPIIPGASKDVKDDEDVDTTLAHISSRLNPQATSKKGKLEQIIWDEEIDRMNRDKKAAEATWGMITLNMFFAYEVLPNQTVNDNFLFRSQNPLPSQIRENSFFIYYPRLNHIFTVFTVS